jgi:DNA polymerase III epsilon subunit-like protein
MTELTLSTVCFVDFEASSLSHDSWPIEVGLSWIDDGRVKTWASLIRPDPSWSMEAWHLESEAVHNIPSDMLTTAPAAEDVAREFLSRSEGRILVSDAPSFDRFWMKRLLDVIDTDPMPRVFNIGGAVSRLLDDVEMRVFWRELEFAHMPHRAGKDSAAMAGALRAATRGRT